jgi:hypothetical protein
MAKTNKLDTTAMLILGAVGGYAIILAILSGHGSIEMSEEVIRYPDATARVAALATASDQVITMLFTMLVGVLVGIGFIFRDRDFRFKASRVAQLVLVGLLGIGCICSVYYGYAARMQLLEMIRNSQLPFQRIDTTISRQALSLAVVVGAALALFIIYFAEKNRLGASRASGGRGGGKAG